MSRTTRRGPTRAQVSAALLAFRATALGAVLALTVTTGMAASGGDRTPPPALDSYTQVVQRAMSQHNCSTTGFAPDVQPDWALVRTNRGRLRVVPFEHGWDVFTGRRPGLLVAVCLGRPTAGPARAD